MRWMTAAFLVLAGACSNWPARVTPDISGTYECDSVVNEPGSPGLGYIDTAGARLVFESGGDRGYALHVVIPSLSITNDTGRYEARLDKDRRTLHVRLRLLEGDSTFDLTGEWQDGQLWYADKAGGQLWYWHRK